jgi:hypothetical protein
VTCHGTYTIRISVDRCITGGTLYKVKKTSIYLEPELDLALARRATVVGVTKAELIRQTLRRSMDGTTQPRITAIGVGDGPGDVADNVDRYLLETGFGER